MKDDNKFLVWAKTYSLNTQKQLMYRWLCSISLIILIVGILLAKILEFNMAIIPLPGFAIAFCVVYLLRDHFYNAETILKLQLRYLMREKQERRLENYKDFVDQEWKDDTEWRRAEDYKEITIAIEHVQKLQMHCSKY